MSNAQQIASEALATLDDEWSSHDAAWWAGYLEAALRNIVSEAGN